MNRREELEIISDVLSQKTSGSSSRTVEQAGHKYVSKDHFLRELDNIFRRSPQAVATGSELSPGGFIRQQVCGYDVVVTRDESGKLHAFHNICKHRAAKVCQHDEGKASKFVCPYHTWTYNERGERISLPEKDAFPDEAVRLDPVQVDEHLGLIWLYFGEEALDRSLFDTFLGERLTTDLEEAGLSEHTVLATTVRDWPVNWKLAVEGGLENYHFRSVHSDSVGPQFSEKSSGFALMNSHLRFVTPRKTITSLEGKEADKSHLRPHAFITYLVLPNLNVFLERNHIALHIVMPVAANRTRMVMKTLVPNDANLKGKAGKYFEEAHRLTEVILQEDYDIHTMQQQSLEANPETTMTFGKQEGGLTMFHDWLDRNLFTE